MTQKTDVGYALVEILKYTPSPLDGPGWDEREPEDYEIELDGEFYAFYALGESWLRTELMNTHTAADHFEGDIDMIADLMADKDYLLTVWKQVSNYDPPNWTGGPDEWLSVEFVGVADMDRLPLLVKDNN